MSEISRSEYRAVMKFLTLEQQPANNIYERLVNVHGDSAPSYSTVTRWVAEFKRGWTSLEDDTRAGRLVEATTDDCCHAVKKLMVGDRRLKVLEIATELDISHGSILNILHEHLGLSEVRSRWAPCFLTPVQKSFRGSMFGAVGYIQCNPVQRVVPCINWWWNVDSPLGSRHQTGFDAVETRQLSSTQEVLLSTVGWKVMATILWDYKVVLLVDYLPQKTAITGQWTLLRWSADKSASGSEGEAEANVDPRSAVAAR